MVPVMMLLSAGGRMAAMVSAVFLLIAQRQEACTDQQGKDHEQCLAKRLGKGLHQGAIIKKDVEHGRDDQQPAEPFMGRLDQADVHLEKEQDPGNRREDKGSEGKGGNPCAGDTPGLSLVSDGVFVHQMFLVKSGYVAMILLMIFLSFS